MPKNEPTLDLLSTSQTNPPQKCVYGAPLVALIMDKPRIIQSCCNHWECPHCGQIRARQEYRRIVDGCEKLAADGHKLYFWTLTCRGKEISIEEAEESYYAWTNVLLTNARTKAKREMDYWCYVQVTERQKKTRQHPHSHIITTFCPRDAKRTRDASGAESYASAWMARANASAGLGRQHRISLVNNAAAVSRYVAKYMFKEFMYDTFPPKWKRVRYSANFPPLAWIEPAYAQVLTAPSGWKNADKQGVDFEAETIEIWRLGSKHMAHIHPPKVNMLDGAYNL